MRRLLRHLLFFPWRLRQIFSHDVLAAIEREIAASEQRHSGQIRFAVEANLDLMQLLRGLSSRDRALELFAQLRVWDTECNNGVLIYLMLAEHRVEIVADRGFNAKLEPAVWQDICRRLQERLHRGEYAAGICACIHEVDVQIATHFPDTGAGVNELPDRPVLL